MDEESAFRPSARDPTPDENKKWPGVFIMETCIHPATTVSSYREILVPLIGLRALQHVRYRSLVPLILEANRDEDISFADMQLLWDTIVHQVYYFVCACEKEAKAMEVCT